VVDTGVLTVVDGDMGFGQVIAEETMERLAGKARQAGIALAAIRNVGHVGRLGDWAEQLAGHGLVSLHFLNTTGLGMMAMPFGGTDRRLSLNPMAIAVPLPGRPPLLLDFTTSVVAEGKLAVARNKGEQVAPGTIVDKHGRPTTDPNDFYAGGALLTIAGHKGHGLAVMIDILAGGLSGGGCTRPGETVLANPMTSIAIDPAQLGSADAFAAEVSRFADHVTASPPSRPGEPVRMPGDVEHETRAKRLAEGIPLDDESWRQIAEAGESVGVPRAESERLAGIG
jgi:uncharacterized oxidoreductase